ncbi:transposase [Arundinibacter roseus]|uniref:Transposase zinc-ribbon domain-containing protein n=1 Tax=Arundinibacter roseus TaxID=2070510 RepID=A0A4R4JZQ8_9BACT|nr:hypothetical protein EZE20_21005 [Arundinibacter roseus]
MEKRFKCLTLFEFQEKFPVDDSCKLYLANLKWSNGFSCSKCGHTKYRAGNGPHDCPGNINGQLKLKRILSCNNFLI